jgi:hypothetical protein
MSRYCVNEQSSTGPHPALAVGTAAAPQHHLQFKASNGQRAAYWRGLLQRRAFASPGRRHGEGPQRDKADREPDAAAVHLLQAQGRALQEGKGARRPVRRRPAAAPLLRLREAVPLPLAHRAHVRM